ncbi:MAG: hypothetical protein WBP79_13735 [Candidatus Acidiferrales bacterium]
MEDGHRRVAAGIARGGRRRVAEGHWVESDREQQVFRRRQVVHRGDLDLGPMGRQDVMETFDQLAERPPVLVHRELPPRGAALALQRAGPELHPELPGASELVSSRLPGQFPASLRPARLPQQPAQRRAWLQPAEQQVNPDAAARLTGEAQPPLDPPQVQQLFPQRLELQARRPQASRQVEQPVERQGVPSPQSPWQLFPLRLQLPAQPNRGNVSAPIRRARCRSSLSASSFL